MIFFLNRMNWIKAVNNLITNSKAEGINHVFCISIMSSCFWE